MLPLGLRAAPAWLAAAIAGCLLAPCESLRADAGPGGKVDVVGEATVAVLLIGNSHSSRHRLPELLETLLANGLADDVVVVERAPGWAYLADRVDDTRTIRAFESRRWTHVVLQAQKYSTSGNYRYPTDGAEEWIRRAHAIGAVPVLFPEWARRGNDEEGLRVQRLHETIASRASACVAPVGIAWEVAEDNRAGIVLHASDGNHANRRGALLTAYVLYEVISGRQAVRLPVLDSIGVNAGDQAYLKSVASTLLESRPACEFLR